MELLVGSTTETFHVEEGFEWSEFTGIEDSLLSVIWFVAKREHSPCFSKRETIQP